MIVFVILLTTGYIVMALSAQTIDYSTCPDIDDLKPWINWRSIAIRVSHSVFRTDQALVPGLQYNVSVDTDGMSATITGLYVTVSSGILIQSERGGQFERCSVRHVTLSSHLATPTTVAWQSVASHHSTVSIRVYAILKNGTRTMVEMNKRLLTECHLSMLSSSHLLDISMLPAAFSTCQVIRQPASESGQIVQLTRLSVPGIFGLCSPSKNLQLQYSHTKISQFDRTLTLCGKLLDLPTSLLAVNSSATVTVTVVRHSEQVHSNNDRDAVSFTDFGLVFTEPTKCNETIIHCQQQGSFLLASDIDSCRIRLIYPIGHQFQLRVDTVNNLRSPLLRIAVKDGSWSELYQREVSVGARITSRTNDITVQVCLPLTTIDRVSALITWRPVIKLTCSWPMFSVGGGNGCYHVSRKALAHQPALQQCHRIDSNLLKNTANHTELFSSANEEMKIVLHAATYARSNDTFWLENHQSGDIENHNLSEKLNSQGENKCQYMMAWHRNATDKVYRTSTSLCSAKRKYICFKPRGFSQSSFGNCNQTYRLIINSPEHVHLQSNHTGFGLYTQQNSCINRVTSPAGTHMQVSFKRFHMEPQRECVYDWLEIIDGNISRGRLCDNWNSKVKMLDFRSQSNHLIFKFHNDFSNNFGEFDLVVKLLREERLCRNEYCLTVHYHPRLSYKESVDVCSTSQGQIADVSEVTPLKLYLIDRVEFWSAESNSLLDTCSTFRVKSGLIETKQRHCSSKYLTICLYSRVLHPDWPRISTIAGTLTSPGYNKTGYPTGIYIETTLMAPSVHFWLMIHVHQLHLEQQTPLCLYDVLHIRWQSGNELLCGVVENRTIYVKTNSAKIRLKTDQTITASGFKLTWSPIDVATCENSVQVAQSGLIESIGFPNFAPYEINCSVNIFAQKLNYIVLHWSAIDMPCSTSSMTLAEIQQPSNRNDSESLTVREIKFLLGNTGARNRYSMTKCLCDAEFSNKVLLMGVSAMRLIHQTFNSTRNAEMSTNSRFSVDYSSLEKGGTIYMDSIQVDSSPTLVYERVEPLQSYLAYQEHHRIFTDIRKNVELEIQCRCVLSDQPCHNEYQQLLIRDVYEPGDIREWWVCRKQSAELSHISIRSHLHVLYVIYQYGSEKSTTSSQPSSQSFITRLRATAKKDKKFHEKNLDQTNTVEHCRFSPCLHSSKCVITGKKPGQPSTCFCNPGYYGRFCQLHACQPSPCVFGKCHLSEVGFDGYRCMCSLGYTGRDCDRPQSPCDSEPCQGRGFCYRVQSTFRCRCYAWWSGIRCEKRMPNLKYRPLSERMLKEPFWLGLIAIAVVLVIISIFWCIKKHFADRIERFFAEEIERSKYNYYIPSPSPSHAKIRDSPQPSPTPGRNFLQRLSFRKTSRLSLLSMSSVSSSPGRELRRSTEDFFRSQFHKRIKSPSKDIKYMRASSTDSQRLTTASSRFVGGLMTPTAPLNQRSHSCDEVGCIGSEDNTKYSAADMGVNSCTHEKSKFQDIIKSNFDKKVKFDNLMAQITSEIQTSSESELSLQSDMEAYKQKVKYPNSIRPRPLQIQRLNPSMYNSSSEDVQDSYSVSSDITTDFNPNSRKFLHSFSTPSSPSQRPLSKIISADNILTMLRSWSNRKAKSSPVSPIFGDSKDDISQSFSQNMDGTFFGSAHSSFEKLTNQSIEVPVHHMGSKSSVALTSMQSVTLELPSCDYRCLSPIKEVPTPSPSPLPTPNKHIRHPINIEPLSVNFSDSNYQRSVFYNKETRSTALVENPLFKTTPPKSTNADNFTCVIPKVLIESPNSELEIDPKKLTTDDRMIVRAQNIIPEIRIGNAFSENDGKSTGSFLDETLHRPGIRRFSMSSVNLQAKNDNTGFRKRRNSVQNHHFDDIASPNSDILLQSPIISLARSNSESNIQCGTDIQLKQLGRSAELKGYKYIEKRNNRGSGKPNDSSPRFKDKVPYQRYSDHPFQLPEIVVQEASSISPESSSDENVEYWQSVCSVSGKSTSFSKRTRNNEQQLSSEVIEYAVKKGSTRSSKRFCQSVSSRSKNFLSRLAKGKFNSSNKADNFLLKRDVPKQHQQLADRRHSFNVPRAECLSSMKRMLQPQDRCLMEKFPSDPNLTTINKSKSGIVRQSSLDSSDEN